MNFKILISGLVLVASLTLFAADITAPKMELIDSENGRLTVFPEGIVISDKDMKITGKRAIFFEKDNRAIIKDSLTITNPQYTITADSAIYSFTEKISVLQGNVVVESDTLEIRTNELIFDQRQNLVKSQQGLVIKEKRQNILVSSKIGEYDFNQALGITDSLPTLFIFRSDTTVISSKKMVLDNNQYQYYAVESVTVKNKDSYLYCDTLLFFVKEDSGVAFANPRISENENQLSGEKIWFYFDSQDSVLNGNESKSLNKIRVDNNVNAKYFTKENGVVEINNAKYLIINYQDNEVKNIYITGDSLNLISGTYRTKEKL
ncbi:MAG: LptA/OstA family protein [candidate division WOR-3 bacterium]